MVEIKNYISKRNIIIGISVLLVSIIPFFFSIKSFFPDFNPVLRFVSGTEYISGESGQIIVRVSDSDGNPLANANCNVSILYPDKSYFVVDVPLVPSSELGNYYAQFTTPTITGIYEETARCSAVSKGRERKLTLSSSFHVSVALNFIVEMSQLQAERYKDIVARLNQTILNINSSREDVLKSINRTFNEQFVVEMAKTQSNITSTMDNKFSKIYRDFSDLGASMQNIFTK